MPVDVFYGMTVAQKQALLAQAVKAYGDLMTGGKPVSLSYTQGDGGKSVSFSAAEAGNLTLLIKQLQVSLGLLRRARRPIRFIF